MAKQSLEIKDFSGGLNCSADARDIQDNEFPQLWNVTSSQQGILKMGGSLVQHIYGLPHNSSNYQEGYGLFATSIDTTPSIINGQFESGIEEGTFQTAYDDEDATEILNNTGDFSSNWSVTGDFAVDATDATFTYSSGSGTLSQTSFSHAGTASKLHAFTYTISGAAFTSLTLKGAGGDNFFASEDISIPTTVGTHTVNFKAHGTLTKFQLNATKTSGTSNLDDFSLKQIRGIHLSANPTLQSYSNHNTDDFYNNKTIVVYSGTGIGQSRRIVDYTGATKVGLIDFDFDTSIGDPDASSKYKIYNWATDSIKFGDAVGGSSTKDDYIDKGGSDFPFEDGDSHSTYNQNSYFLRTESSTIADTTSEDLGFITYNPKSSYDWASNTELSTSNTSIGNTTLESGLTYTFSFWCKAKERYYGYTSNLKECITNSQDRDIASGTINWVEYSPSTNLPVDGSYAEDTSTDDRIEITGTSGTTKEGAELGTSFMTTLIPGKLYKVEATLYCASGTISDFKFELGGVASSSFSINTIKRKYVEYIKVTSDAALRIYYENNSTTEWFIDNISVRESFGERVPFVQIYSDSVTDGTNTGLYLNQGNNDTVFTTGTYNADGLTNEYVKNGDFEIGTATGGDGGYTHIAGTHTYCPPTDWSAYDGFTHDSNNWITYSYNSDSDSFGGEGNTLVMTPGSDYSFDNYSTSGERNPNCYLYQDLKLPGNQWYELSFAYSSSTNEPIAFSIKDNFDLVSTGLVSNDTDGTGNQEDAADGSTNLTVVGTATNALVENKELYNVYGDFLGVCTGISSGTVITFGGGLVNDIPDNTTLHTSKYIKSWNEDLYNNEGTANQHLYYYGGKTGNRYKRKPYRFFVKGSGSATRSIRISFAPFDANQVMRLDGVSVKKSFPDLCSISNQLEDRNPYSDDIKVWKKYSFNFTIPSEYNNADDWVINLNAGSYGYQNGTTGASSSQIVYLDTIKLETENKSDNLIFLNDNKSSESCINIYSENKQNWIDNTGLRWDGINMKPVYTYINGLLKISDANFESENSSKIFYYNNSKYDVRDNPLSLPPEFIVSAGQNSFEVDQHFDALDYNNTYTYEQAHQWVTHLTETNWSIDNADGHGRILWYAWDGATANKGNLYASSGDELQDYSPADISSTETLYYLWCGQHGGSSNIAANDMDTTMNSLTTGSVSRITFEFTHSFQGCNTRFSNYDYLSNAQPPHIEVKAGKAVTDIFDSGTEVSDANQKLLALNINSVASITGTAKDATLYRDELGGHVYSNENGIGWQASANYEWENISVASFNTHCLKGQKTLYGEVNFEDGEIEITDDILLEVSVKSPNPTSSNNSYRKILTARNSADGDADSNVGAFPRWEKIKFSNIKVHFRSTNWTAIVDGFDSSKIDATKINFNFGTPSGATAFGWEERIFEVGVSSVNIYDEESSIQPSNVLIGTTTSGNAETSVSTITSGQSPDTSIYVGNDVFNDDYRKQLKYYMKDTKSDIWYLQFYINLETNTCYSTTSAFKSNGVKSETNKCYQYFIPREKVLNYNEVDSYESQTLVSQNLTNSELICDYKTAVVANNRLYVGNIRQDGKIYPDRMIKSPINKYNILPKDNFIDVAINDGDEITALEYYKDKLLQFKKRKVFVINTSGDYEFLEDTFENIGVNYPYQVCKTPYGIVWANQSGLHVYNGESMTNLIENKIPNNASDALISSKNYWQFSDDEDSTNNIRPVVGYDAMSKDIIVKLGASSLTTIATSIDGYIYNIDSQSWYFTERSFNIISRNAGTPYSSNFVSDSKGNLISYNYFNASESNNSLNKTINDIVKWKHTEGTDEDICERLGITGTNVNCKNMYFTTKDYTFGNISSRNKIYKIYITYKSENSSDVSTDSKILVKYATNGSDTFSGTFKDSSTNYAASTGLVGSQEWQTAILKPSSSINNIYSLKLQFSYLSGVSTFPSPKFQINDISIIFRNKRVK